MCYCIPDILLHEIEDFCVLQNIIVHYRVSRRFSAMYIIDLAFYFP